MSEDQQREPEVSEDAERALQMWEQMTSIVRNTPMGRLREMEDALGAPFAELSFDDLRTRMWLYQLAHPELDMDAVERMTLRQVEDGILAWEDPASTPSPAPEGSGSPGSAGSTASTPGTSGA